MGLVNENKQLPEVYSDGELDTLEAHISSHFGNFLTVFHEITSTDIHVDICFIDPTPERDFYTLVTMGMGAHRMNVPNELKDKKLDRAEILVTLPPDWEIHNQDEKWYWPLRWLKVLARLPGEHDTWLGYGHTVPNGHPFAENTRLSGVLLTMPYFFGPESSECPLPDGSLVRFYQMMPLYDSEMEYKRNHNTQALEDLFPEDFDLVVDINRKNVVSERDHT